MINIKTKTVGIIVSTAIFLMLLWFSAQSSEVSQIHSDQLLLKMELITELDIYEYTPKYEYYSTLIRKGIHFLTFLILGMGVSLLLEEDFKIIILIVVLIAVFDEFHQSFNGRGSSLSDVLLDVAGGFTGWAIIEFMKCCLKKTEKS